MTPQWFESQPSSAVRCLIKAASSATCTAMCSAAGIAMHAAIQRRLPAPPRRAYCRHYRYGGSHAYCRPSATCTAMCSAAGVAMHAAMRAAAPYCHSYRCT
eukprot:355273-Chlamydomonas_euryale.AAC.1